MEPIAEYRRIADQIARDHGITVVVQEHMPAGVAAFAEWRTRTVTVPPITDDVSFAIRLHEFGHITAGECTNVAPHYRDPAVTEWWECNMCEPLAWAEALRFHPFSLRMFRRLKDSLTYRRKTRAHTEALIASRRVASDSSWAMSLTAHADRQRRADMMREMDAAAAEARRPRPLTILERQIADFKLWSAEG